ncbi:hypothetical protein LUZ63_003467 [Rhynchospora breviuscula]|uniref:KIB1-4 beta-propeller domain-containing protein n=1 Tax=Rhynchospora breviuscula TaxID=2022672 RepID=A0A9Q0D0S1_9POAL|nr:hypothetical protein LUZ63_003467 [Rhynchospora breviuscula]
MFLVSVADSIERKGFPASCIVHRVEISNHTWKLVESIGGCVFFLAPMQSSALPPAQEGAECDCIYIVNICFMKGIYKICLQDQTVSLSFLLKWPERWSQLFWLMPIRVYHSWRRKHDIFSFTHPIGTDKSDAAHVQEEKKKEEKCKVDISRPWADMPIELVQLLLPRLYLIDCLRLPSVCKAWNTLTNLIQDAKVYPWFLCTTNDKSFLWNLFDPVYGKEYSIDMKWLDFTRDISFQFSKDGWVLVLKEDKYLFLINPFTRECIGLPEKDCRKSFAMSFSSSPTNLDCIVLVISYVRRQILEISTWRPGEDEWDNFYFDYLYGFLVPFNPVFIGGEFYCFCRKGKLLVYNPKKQTLQLFETQSPLQMSFIATREMESYLMESMGDLIAVFRGSSKEPPSIFKLDQQSMVWCEVDGIGDSTIFLNLKTSLAKPCLEKRCPNLIYFSRFADKHCKRTESFFLETNKCHPEDCYYFKEPMNCIWIEPNLTA